MTCEQIILNSIEESGLLLEQVGHRGCVTFEIDEHGCIFLCCGPIEEYCENIEAALSAIALWAEEFGANPEKQAQIVKFVQYLSELLGSEDKCLKLGCGDIVEAAHKLANRIGLDNLGDSIECGDSHIFLDTNDIGFFEDENNVIWRVFFKQDEQIDYVEINLDDYVVFDDLGY
jgi:hypothetical protein